jgi:predicted nucleic acid-binding Zn ribbon protein
MAKKRKMKAYHAHVGCRDCGKPIVFSDKDGMFCEDKCGRAESIEIGKIMRARFGLLKGRP